MCSILVPVFSILSNVGVELRLLDVLDAVAVWA